MFYSWIWAQSKPKSSSASMFLLRNILCPAGYCMQNKHPAFTHHLHLQPEHFLTTSLPGTRCPLLLASSSWTSAPHCPSCSSLTALGWTWHLLFHAVISIPSCLKPKNFVGSCAPWPHSTITSRLQPFKTTTELKKTPPGCRPSYPIILAIVRIFALLLQALLVTPLLFNLIMRLQPEKWATVTAATQN